MRIVDAQSALAFLVQQASHIEPQVYRRKYPDIQYQDLVPVDTGANEWARSVTFFSSDMVGKAQWFHHQADDIPQADVSRDKFESQIEMAAIGYSYTLEELGYQMLIPGMNLSADRALAAKRAYEEFVEGVALRGDPEKNYDGLFDLTGVTAVQAPNDGTSSSRYFSAKTPAQIIRDLNSGLQAIYTNSLTTEVADTVLMPISVLQHLAFTQYSTAAAESVLEYFMKANVYTLTTGQQLTVRGVRGLETAAADGTGRIIFYRRDPEVLKLHIPMPHRFLPAYQVGPLKFTVPGIFRLGGVEARLPNSIRYLDNVSAAP